MNNLPRLEFCFINAAKINTNRPIKHINTILFFFNLIHFILLNTKNDTKTIKAVLDLSNKTHIDEANNIKTHIQFIYLNRNSFMRYKIITVDKEMNIANIPILSKYCSIIKNILDFETIIFILKNK